MLTHRNQSSSSSTSKKKQASIWKSFRTALVLLLFFVIFFGFNTQTTLNLSEYLATITDNHAVAKSVSPLNGHLRQLNPFFQNLYKQIDNDDEKNRCERYGFAFNRKNTRRRIFFGALIADDSIDTFDIHSTELYDVYHTIAFVEANTTFSGAPRTMRFRPGSELYNYITSGIFGKNTAVYVDPWLEEAPKAIEMTREAIQRESIGERFVKAGLRPDDIIIVSDLDEMFSRDFLRAAQICDIDPIFGPKNDACLKPKLHAQAMVFEMSPECRQERIWYHPELMLGNCLEGVGDQTGRPNATREYEGTRGDRVAGFRDPSEYSSEINALGRYPLWTTQDLRGVGGDGLDGMATYKNGSGWSVAYHFHNFFTTANDIRHKYKTYGHADPLADRKKLSAICSDMDMVVRCVHNLPNRANPYADRRITHPFRVIGGPAPLLFLDAEYRKQRHEFVTDVVLRDEATFGSFYTDELIKTKTLPPEGIRPCDNRERLADGCYHIFIDIGSREGTNGRMVFEPDKYPQRRFLEKLDEMFGKERSLKDMCVFAFEVNPVYKRNQFSLQFAYAKMGWRYRYMPFAVGNVDDPPNSSIDFARWLKCHILGRDVPEDNVRSPKEQSIAVLIDEPKQDLLMIHRILQTGVVRSIQHLMGTFQTDPYFVPQIVDGFNLTSMEDSLGLWEFMNFHLSQDAKSPTFIEFSRDTNDKDNSIPYPKPPVSSEASNGH